MAFNIKNDEADSLLRQLTRITGESLTDAVIVSIRERLDRELRLRTSASHDPLGEAIARLRNFTVVDDRDLDDILGFDARGLPQ